MNLVYQPAALVDLVVPLLSLVILPSFLRDVAHCSILDEWEVRREEGDNTLILYSQHHAVLKLFKNS